MQSRANASLELEVVDSNGRKSEWIDVDFPWPRSEVATTSIVAFDGHISHWANDAWPTDAHLVIEPDEVQAKMNRVIIARFIQSDSDFVVVVHPNFSRKKHEQARADHCVGITAIASHKVSFPEPESELELVVNV